MPQSHRQSEQLILTLPDWVDGFITAWDQDFESVESRMRFAIELARLNVEHRTGGPFGAAVFDADSGKLIAAGVNLVRPAHCSIAHGEMVALALAQQTVGTFDLGQGGRICELVTSTEPCAMCFGAVPWSGVRRLICGARGEDACAQGFDEGDKPADWIGALQTRGIQVTRDILRDEARAVLQQYRDAGGPIYNSRGD
jgi:tRNA(Arg) A34 adenosine deaminase TadA